MLVVMKKEARPEHVKAVCLAIEAMGFSARPMPGELRTAIGVVGNDGRIEGGGIRALPGVAEVIHVSSPFKQVSREWRSEPTVIVLDNGVRIGGDEVVVMAGPCAVEGQDKLLEVAEAVSHAGVRVLRGGAFKPRTSPYSFQGLGVEGLQILAEARRRYGLAIITEAIDLDSADEVAEHADIIQIGARNMQNFALLKHVGTLGRPVMLKRGMSATIKEWLLAAEYILNAGNSDVILCERGIRSFDATTRNVMDITAVALAKTLTHLPIVADPSHATGRRDMVAPVARASVAAGADGVMVETHPRPAEALSDGPQALLPSELTQLMGELEVIGGAIGRPLLRAG